MSSKIYVLAKSGWRQASGLVNKESLDLAIINLWFIVCWKLKGKHFYYRDIFAKKILVFHDSHLSPPLPHPASLHTPFLLLMIQIPSLKKKIFMLLNILIPFLTKRFNQLQFQSRDFKCTNIKDFTKFTIISCWRLEPKKERKPQDGWFLLNSRPSKTQVLTWALHGFKLL